MEKDPSRSATPGAWIDEDTGGPLVATQSAIQVATRHSLEERCEVRERARRVFLRPHLAKHLDDLPLKFLGNGDLLHRLKVEKLPSWNSERFAESLRRHAQRWQGFRRFGNWFATAVLVLGAVLFWLGTGRPSSAWDIAAALVVGLAAGLIAVAVCRLVAWDLGEERSEWLWDCNLLDRYIDEASIPPMVLALASDIREETVDDIRIHYFFIKQRENCEQGSYDALPRHDLGGILTLFHKGDWRVFASWSGASTAH